MARLEEKIHNQDTFSTLDKDIQAWAQRINYQQSLVKSAEKKKETINVCDLNFLDQSMDAEITMGIERALTTRKLGMEPEHLKAQDLRIDQRLDQVQTHFDDMKRELGL